MSSIELQNVSRQFAQFHALRDVSLSIASREVITVVGPSGCGKSTLLRILAGLDFPTSGNLLIDGKSMRSVPARSRNVAMVFQSYALYPHMTVHENLSLNLRLKSVARDEIERRVRETAAMLDIQELLSKRPHQLSGGQRQRVAVGRALIRKPGIFLFDEPLSNLDALLRERVRHDLKELFKKIDATVVYVTHDQIEAMTLADRVVVLDRGSVQQVGTPDELYRSPSNRFVASFIGTPSMNMLETTIRNGTIRIGPMEIPTAIAHTGPVHAGIRPDAIRIGDGIPAEVAWVESLGGQVLIGVKLGDISLAVLSNQRPNSTSVGLQISGDDIHVFEKDSGQNLLHRDRRSSAVR